MSFDLAFCRQDHSVPSTTELKQYFSSARSFQVNDIAEGGVEFWYKNESTGVYFVISYSPLDAAELEGSGSAGLEFNLNYMRPSFFAYETMPIVEAFARHFDLLVEDPQEETVEPANTERLISSWRAHNSRAVSAMVDVAKNKGMATHYLPEPRATEWWRYMHVRQEIEDSITEDIFAPNLFILESPAKQMFTMLSWTGAISQFFPPCDFVFVQREKKRLFKTVKDTGLVPYQTVMEAIAPLLDQYQVGNLKIGYLAPDKVEVMPLFQKLELEPVDLSKHLSIASDSFHDVAPDIN
jgi:hypothetical protein